MSILGALIGFILFQLFKTQVRLGELRSEFEQALDDYDVIPEVKLHRLHPNAQFPAYARLGDAGADMFSVDDTIIYPMEWKVLDCGFAMELPEGWEAQVRSRSGSARKDGIVVLNSPGTVDSGYRGPMGVLLMNFGGKPYQVKAGDRIAQMVIARAPQAKFVEAAELEESDRGKSGWGSSGR